MSGTYAVGPQTCSTQRMRWWSAENRAEAPESANASGGAIADANARQAGQTKRIVAHVLEDLPLDRNSPRSEVVCRDMTKPAMRPRLFLGTLTLCLAAVGCERDAQTRTAAPARPTGAADAGAAQPSAPPVPPKAARPEQLVPCRPKLMSKPSHVSSTVVGGDGVQLRAHLGVLTSEPGAVYPGTRLSLEARPLRDNERAELPPNEEPVSDVYTVKADDSGGSGTLTLWVPSPDGVSARYIWRIKTKSAIPQDDLNWAALMGGHDKTRGRMSTLR